MLLSYDIWVTPALSRSKAKHSRKLEAVTFKNKDHQTSICNLI